MQLPDQGNKILLLAILVIVATESHQVASLQPRVESSNNKHMSLNNVLKPEFSAVNQYTTVKDNEIDDRIVLSEPLKIAIQTTARFAIQQTKLSNHVNIDAAMGFINDVGYMLSRPANIVKLVKSLAIAIVSFIVSTLVFPGLYRSLDAFYQDPVHFLKLDKYLSEDINERSILALLNSKTDKFLKRIGLAETQCRELYVCHIGEGLRYVFPDSAEGHVKVVSNHLSGFGYHDNIYLKAFTNGVIERNCSSTYTTNSGQNCLGNLFNVFVLPRIMAPTQQPRYQTITAGRSA